MRIRELFVVPEGKKVTEKVFGRVLLSSICSILLCMACLISTTWAWFAVSIENKENVITVATVTAKVTVTDESGASVSTDSSLQNGTYTANIALDTDASEAKAPVYVLITVRYDENPAAYYYCTAKNGKATVTVQFPVERDQATVSFSVSWVAPANASPIDTGMAADSGEPTESVPEDVSEPPADASTAPSTEGAAEPSEEDPSEPSAEPEA